MPAAVGAVLACLLSGHLLTAVNAANEDADSVIWYTQSVNGKQQAVRVYAADSTFGNVLVRCRGLVCARAASCDSS